MKNLLNTNKDVFVKIVRKNELIKKGPHIPLDMWKKCDCCKRIIYYKDVEELEYVCKYCGNYLRLPIMARIKMLLDIDTFKSKFNIDDMLNGKEGDKQLREMLIDNQELFDKEQLITGIGKINGILAAVAVLKGKGVNIFGRQIVELIEYSTREKLPLIILAEANEDSITHDVYVSIQLKEIINAISRHDKEGLLYISVLTNSKVDDMNICFAMTADIIISEIRNKSDDYKELFNKGQVDLMVRRDEIRNTIYSILKLHL